MLNIDLAPTIIELAGGAAPDDMDGASFAALLRNNHTQSKPSSNRTRCGAVVWEQTERPINFLRSYI